MAPPSRSSWIPRPPLFPFLLPPIPHTIPFNTPQLGHLRQKLATRRNLVQEANDLSDEEQEIEDTLHEIRTMGYNYIVPLGKQLTQHEEKADAQVDTASNASSSTSNGSGEAEDENDVNEPGATGDEEEDDEEEEEGEDLDADMTNLDDPQDQDQDTSVEMEGSGSFNGRLHDHDVQGSENFINEVQGIDFSSGVDWSSPQSGS